MFGHNAHLYEKKINLSQMFVVMTMECHISTEELICPL